MCATLYSGALLLNFYRLEVACVVFLFLVLSVSGFCMISKNS